ncbi:MAG: ATP-binding protein [Bacteroidota bacterium]|nr:ATP-binding protein [Bacteroidota bacterium]
MDNLFNLNLNNLAGVALAFIPALLNFGIIIYILRYLPDRTITRVFALFTFALFCWQMVDSFVRLSDSAETAMAWDKIFCIGWIFVGPLGLYFSLLYTQKKKNANKPWVLCLLFLPALFFETIFKGDFIPHNYIYSGFWGWVDQHDLHILDKIMILWISFLVMCMLVLLVRHAYRVRHRSDRFFPTLLICIGLGIPTIQGIVTQVLFPLAMDMAVIPVTSTFMSCFSIATVIALRGHSLFNISDSIHAETVLDNMSDIVFTVLPSGQISYINTYGTALLGVDPLLVEQYDFRMLFPKNKNYLEFRVKVLEPALEGQPVNNFPSCVHTSWGNSIDVIFTADPIFDNRQRVGVLLVAHNVTEMKRAEQEIKDKNKELERSNADLETFAFVASHDLKEPLRMVSNYTQLLARKYENRLDEQAQQYIGYASEGVHRMQLLINDLLEYSRIGKSEMPVETVDFNELAAEIKMNLETTIKDSGATIIYDDLPSLIGFRSQLSRLLQNLIENAIKFRGNKPPVVKLSAMEKENVWQFSVKDNGIGISPEYKEKVFVIFQRLHERTRYPGTGIGLSVCKKIVELHGGTIWLESEPGKGTTFFFTIPKQEGVVATIADPEEVAHTD